MSLAAIAKIEPCKRPLICPKHDLPTYL
jgi:hypothetical protein